MLAASAGGWPWCAASCCALASWRSRASHLYTRQQRGVSTQLAGRVLHCTALNRHPQHRQQVVQEAQPAAGSAPVSQLKCDRCRLPPFCRRLRILA